MKNEVKDIAYLRIMLGKAKTMCDYCLRQGNRKEAQLHAKNMKDIYNELPDENKPKWLRWEQIIEYEKQIADASTTN